MEFKEVNLKYFVISLLASIIFAIFNLLPLTIVGCTFMLCCFIDKSGYENRCDIGLEKESKTEKNEDKRRCFGES